MIKGLARNFPGLRLQIVTGVSASAINATFLAAREGTLGQKGEALAELWRERQCEHVFTSDALSLMPFRRNEPYAFVDTKLLSELLQRVVDCRPGEPIEGIIRNVRPGELKAVSLMTLDYNSGQSVRWFQGREMDEFDGPNRRSESTQLTLEHVLASSALPFVFSSGAARRPVARRNRHRPPSR